MTTYRKRFADAVHWLTPIVMTDLVRPELLPWVTDLTTQLWKTSCRNMGNTPVIAADAAAAAFARHPREEWQWDTDYPGSTPKESALLVEWRRPPAFYSDAKGWNPSTGQPQDVAVFMTRFDGERVRKCDDWPEKNMHFLADVVRAAAGMEAAAAARDFVAFLFMHGGVGGGEFSVPGVGCTAHGEDGRPLMPPVFAVFGGKPELAEPMTDFLSSMLQPALFTLAMINGGGATATTVHPPPKLDRKHEERYGRRLVSYRLAEMAATAGE